MSAPAVYRVCVEGHAVRSFDTAELALACAMAEVYLSPIAEDDQRRLLRGGQIAEWSYGFASVQIIPPPCYDRAAVAELIEAAKGVAFNARFTADEDAYHEVSRDEMKRLTAALSAVKL